MKFTTNIPTTPGFYAWRDSRGFVGAVKLEKHGNILKDSLTGVDVRYFGMSFSVEWSRLIPAEEQEKTWREAQTQIPMAPSRLDDEALIAEYSLPNWNNSRARKIMEGENDFY